MASSENVESRMELWAFRPNTFTDSWINKFWPSSCVVDVVAPLNDPEVLFNSRSDSTQPAIRLLRNSPRFDQLKSKSTITGTISPNKLPSWTGVGVKVLFMWLDIVEIIRSGGQPRVLSRDRVGGFSLVCIFLSGK
ncbi:hypothetical protein ACFX15_031450 [Malus domestica]